MHAHWLLSLESKCTVGILEGVVIGSILVGNLESAWSFMFF